MFPSLTIQLGNNKLNDLLVAIQGNRKIEAIKLHREITMLGLKESRDWVESLMGVTVPVDKPQRDYAVFYKTEYEWYLEGAAYYNDASAKTDAKDCLDRAGVAEVLVCEIVARSKTVLVDC
jgi:hypothetical protein